MQNRRIVDAAFAAAGTSPTPVVETDSIAALVNHVRETNLVAVAPDRLCERLGIGDDLVRGAARSAGAACTRWAWWWLTGSRRRPS